MPPLCLQIEDVQPQFIITESGHNDVDKLEYQKPAYVAVALIMAMTGCSVFFPLIITSSLLGFNLALFPSDPPPCDDHACTYVFFRRGLPRLPLWVGGPISCPGFPRAGGGSGLLACFPWEEGPPVSWPASLGRGLRSPGLLPFGGGGLWSPGLLPFGGGSGLPACHPPIEGRFPSSRDLPVSLERKRDLRRTGCVACATERAVVIVGACL